MKNNIFKKFMFLSLSIIVCCGAMSCGKKDVEEKNIEIWTATGLEKILKDEDYSSRYDTKTFSIEVFRNEYESGQIIISPNTNIDAYDITLNDLHLRNDSATTLSKDLFEVYNEKYIYLNMVKEQYVSKGGNYPDALLPFDTAVEYGENKVEKDTNQPIWITVKPEANQKAGIYEGNFELTLDGEKRLVPVEITVFDHALSDTTHVRSSYGCNWNWVAMGELDATTEMQEKYYDFMLDHRINVCYIPTTFNSMYMTADFFDEYLPHCAEAARDSRCSFYSLPYKASVFTKNDFEYTTLNLEFHLELLQKMAKYSLENNVDLFEKADMYLTFLDEFDAQFDGAKTKNALYCLNEFWNFHHALTREQLFALVSGDYDEAFKEQLYQNAIGIAPLVPGNAFALEGYEEYPNAKLIPVDRIREYSYEVIEAYDEYITRAYNEEWWYQATAYYPHVSYNIETPLVSARFNGWMMFDYGISGDLYWETAINHQFTISYDIEYTQTQFDNPTRYPGLNGEGKLLYAGREYGIYGPIGTVRLQGIRDGHEDYDLIYELRELYKSRGVTEAEFNSIYQFFVDGLYEETALVNPTDEQLNISYILNGRRVIAKLFDLYNQNGVVLHEYVSKDDEGKMVLSAPEATTIKVNGEEITPAEKEGYNEYTAIIPLNQKSNKFSVTAKTESKQNGIEFDLGGKRTIIALNDSANYTEGKFSVKKGAEISYDEANKCLKVTPTDITNGVAIQLDAEDLNIDTSSSNMTLNMYVYGSESIKLTLKCKCASDKGFRPVSTYTLKAGWNKINVNVLSQLSCSVKGKLTMLQFEVADIDSIFGVGDIVLEGAA